MVLLTFAPKVGSLENPTNVRTSPRFRSSALRREAHSVAVLRDLELYRTDNFPLERHDKQGAGAFQEVTED